MYPSACIHFVSLFISLFNTLEVSIIPGMETDFHQKQKSNLCTLIKKTSIQMIPASHFDGYTPLSLFLSWCIPRSYFHLLSWCISPSHLRCDWRRRQRDDKRGNRRLTKWEFHAWVQNQLSNIWPCHSFSLCCLVRLYLSNKGLLWLRGSCLIGASRTPAANLLVIFATKLRSFTHSVSVVSASVVVLVSAP